MQMSIKLVELCNIPIAWRQQNEFRVRHFGRLIWNAIIQVSICYGGKSVAEVPRWKHEKDIIVMISQNINILEQNAISFGL